MSRNDTNLSFDQPGLKHGPIISSRYSQGSFNLDGGDSRSSDAGVNSGKESILRLSPNASKIPGALKLMSKTEARTSLNLTSRSLRLRHQIRETC